MSRSNDGCGCFGQIIAIGVILIVGLCVDAYNSSQFGMIRDARSNKNCYEYWNYLRKYPNGRYAEEAKDSLVAISSMDNDTKWLYINIERLSDDPVCEKLSEIAYERALSYNTMDVWKQYIEGVPTKYHRDAPAKIDSIETYNANLKAQLWGTEERAWETASKNDTYEYYLMYIRSYPDGTHKSTANKKIIDFEVARDFNGEHGTMSSMDQTGHSGGQNSKVTITNQTSYEMTLLYSGDVASERMVISAHGTKSLRLPNGRYRISARVNASSVVPYVGTETLTGGNYSASYYISTTQYNRNTYHIPK